MWQEVKGKWKLLPAELLVHRRGFSHSNLVVFISESCYRHWGETSVPKKSKICRALWFGEIKTVKNPICSGSGVDSTASKFVNPQDLLCRQQGSNLTMIFCPSSRQLDKVLSFFFFFLILKCLRDTALLHIYSVNSRTVSTTPPKLFVSQLSKAKN